MIPPALSLVFALSSTWPTPVPEVPLAERKSAVETLAKSLDETYVFPEKGKQAAEKLRARLKSGAYDSLAEGPDFAKSVTADVQAIISDAHFVVRYSATALPKRENIAEPSADEIRVMADQQRRMNYGFERVERLPANIGYIKFNGFMDPSGAEERIAGAMSFVQGTDGLIIDLRDNGGGDPETVRIFCSYFFDEKPRLLNSIYSRLENRTDDFFTLEKLPAPRYLDKPVMVLVSKRTGSAAEECSYNLQTQKRATIVGGVTWGGANPGAVVRLSDHFSAFVPWGRAINPITKTNWEGTGVKPDIEADEKTALVVAQRKLIEGFIGSTKDADWKSRMEARLKELSAG